MFRIADPEIVITDNSDNNARSMIRVRYQYLLSNSIYLFMMISCIREINDK